MKIIKPVRDFINGMIFGLTQTVPGVSGGTVAVILGFYDELIESINRFTRDSRKYTKFLAPMFLGMLAGILIFASVTHYLLTNYSFPTMAFFIGSIVGITPVIYAMVKTPGRWFNLREMALIIVPITFLVILANLKETTVVNPEEVIAGISVSYMVFIFFAGIIAAAALILPGLSGSFLLLLVGIYPLAIYSVSQIRHMLADITNVAGWLDIFKVLIPLGMGVIIGGISMIRLIEKLLRDYFKELYLAILGLLIGSVYALFYDPIVFQSGTSTPVIIAGAITFVIGGIASYLLGKKRL